MSGNRSTSAFLKGGGHFERRFHSEGATPSKHCWYQSSRVIALSCGIKISAMRHLVLSQSTRVTDRQTDRIATPKTALTYARAVKRYEGDCYGTPECDFTTILSIILSRYLSTQAAHGL